MSDNARIENIRLAREAEYLDGDDEDDDPEGSPSSVYDLADYLYDRMCDERFDHP